MVIGLKKVFVTTTVPPGEPMKGTLLGVIEFGVVGVKVQNSKLELSLNLYLVDFCVVLGMLAETASVKFDEVTILYIFGIISFVSS